MRFIASNIRVPLDAMVPGHDKAFRRVVAKAAGVQPSQLRDVSLVRRSIDARKRSDVHYVVSVAFDLAEGARPRGKDVEPYRAPAAADIPDLAAAFARSGRPRPIVVGAGPAGLFCALWLARAGLQPLVVERGQAVEERVQTIAAFDAGAPLDPQSNIQFGEGGAGAFSDGKLNSGKKDPHIRHVLEEFVAAGAPEDILVDAKPHIGTDYLPQTVRGLRDAILRAGGEVRFNTQLVGIRTAPVADDALPVRGQRICAGIFRDLAAGREYELPADALVLAIGHSARDTLEMLYDAGLAMQRKPFAVGVRIEHPQALIDRAQYGRAAGHPALPPADYKLNARTADGRGVYTFCMCPGGTVVAAASEPGGVCTNGMSDHARSGRNANSALLVEVHPADLPGDDALEGIRFQRTLEQAAYDLAQDAGRGAATVRAYAAPAQTVGSFLYDASPEPGAAGAVQPTYPRGTVPADLRACLPAFVADALAEALPKLDRKLRGFADPGAVMTAVEARSSCPVSVLRHRETLESTAIDGVYPAGEGGGHAGGIMTAATDGIRVAESLMRRVALQQAAASAEAAARHLAQGGIAVIPTDTVAGLAVSPQASAAPEALFCLKRRDDRKPISWLIAAPEELSSLGAEVPAYARALAERFWPGALTLVVKASDRIPAAFAAHDGTIGLRMPAHAEALALLRRTGPLAVTSANRSGQPAPSAVGQVDPRILLQAGCALVAAEGSSGVASTVVDCTGPAPRILREGGIAQADILSACAAC